jgi:hypothetical protein
MYSWFALLAPPGVTATYDNPMCRELTLGRLQAAGWGSAAFITLAGCYCWSHNLVRFAVLVVLFIAGNHWPTMWLCA